MTGTAPHRVRPPRGFVYYDVWITVAVLALAAVIIVPNVVRGVRKAHLRGAGASALQRIATAEAARHDRTGTYLDSLPFGLPADTRLLVLRSDSSGWGALVVADSGKRTQVSCGAFYGAKALAPDTAVTVPGRIACW